MLAARAFFGMLFFTTVVLFSFTACHHDPGHTPAGQDPPEAISGCADNEAAEWTNRPTDRNGKIGVAWFPSTSDPSVMITDFAAFHPFNGSYRAPLNVIANNTVSRFGGNMLLRFCCGEDKVVQGQTHSQGAYSEFNFDGTSSIEIAPFGSVRLINVYSWVILRCQQTFDDYTDIPIDFPISVLTICQDSEQKLYELETTFTYQTYGSCNTWDN